MIEHFSKICLLIAIIIISLIIADKIKIKNFENQIPLDIYQFWHTKNLPPKMLECVNKLKKDNPEFEHHLYDIEDCHRFIKKNFDKKVLNAFNKLKPVAFKADLWRYCILYKKGGVYLDIKYECEPGFKLIQLTNNNVYIKEYWNGNYLDNAVNNGFLISKPNNKKFKKIIDQICKHVDTKYYDDFISGQTGPYLLGRYFNKKEMDSIQYTYYEENKRGFVKNINTDKNILSFYPEYRSDQKSSSGHKYWQDMVRDKEVYED